MKIQVISPRGYCYGVINAINLAKKARLENPNDNVYLLGMIVHNKYITKALDKLDIITLDDSNTTRVELIKTIDEGVVVLTAHGSDISVKGIALDKGLKVYDATCADVYKTHNIIKEYINKGYHILYYGSRNHPESIAALSLSNNITQITNTSDIDKLNLDKDIKLFLTNQTTLSIIEAQKIFEYTKSLYPNIVIASEICSATRTRQEALLKIEDDIDLVYVVGDTKSNNSNKLATIANNHKKINAILIESVQDIDLNILKACNKVAITSGASTPTYLTNQVIEYLKSFDYSDKKTHEKPLIDIDKVLD